MDSERLGEVILGCALTDHRALGPALLESADESCLAHELASVVKAFSRPPHGLVWPWRHTTSGASRLALCQGGPRQSAYLRG